MTEPRTRGAHSLTGRLTLAFVGVAVLAVALVVVLMIVGTRRETASLGRSERASAAQAAAQAAARAYRTSGGWAGADLSAARQAARDAGGRLVVLDPQQAPVGASGPGGGGGAGAGAGAGESASAEIRVDGRTVGTAVFRVPGTGLTRAAEQLRDRLVAISLVGGALAIALAAGLALLVARRLTAPLNRLTATARRLESGDLTARAATGGAPGEIGELGAAFDRMAESLADQARGRQALMAEIAHELRTPITILRGNCEAMADGVEPLTRERLGSLHDEVLRLESLVEGLDTLAASEAAGVELERTMLDLADITGRAVDLLRDRAADAGVTIVTQLRPCPVSGDPGRLTQVVENLLTNALKFTPAGGTVTVRVGPDDAGRALLEVRDTGRGIDPAELPHVFERYWRSERAADTGGRGIGLAVVDELVAAHGGTVSVSSEPGRGSCFRVTLPAA